MRISGSAGSQGIAGVNSPKLPGPGGAATGTESYPTADLLALSTAAAAVSSNSERINQLKLQVDSGEYLQPSAGIAQRLIADALARNN